MFLGHLIAKGILLGSPIGDSQDSKPYTSDSSILPVKFQRKPAKLNRSVSVPAMMSNASVV